MPEIDIVDEGIIRADPKKVFDALIAEFS